MPIPKGVIHRDIKPSNIFLVKSTDKIHVQIIDFGLADEIKTSLCRTSQVLIEISGTRPYMAPEQWRGRPQSAPADRYSLAVMAYELLSGHLPFEGSDTEMLRLAVMNDKPEPIPTISESANAGLLKGLAKDTIDWFSSCSKFTAVLNGNWTVVGEAPPLPAKTISFTLPDIFAMSRWGVPDS